jgi:hypothetical protein
VITGVFQGVKYKCKKKVKDRIQKECLCNALYTAMKATCGQPHACNEPGHSPEYYAARLAIAIGCEGQRMAYQQKCWAPKSDPLWAGHMKQIAQEKTIIRKCTQQMIAAQKRQDGQ